MSNFRTYTRDDQVKAKQINTPEHLPDNPRLTAYPEVGGETFDGWLIGKAGEGAKRLPWGAYLIQHDNGRYDGMPEHTFKERYRTTGGG